MSAAHEVAAALRWSVKRGVRSITFAPGMEIAMVEDRESRSRLALRFKCAGLERTVHLIVEHVETKGKSIWFRNNAWRLSPSGIAWTANAITKTIAFFARQDNGQERP